MSNNYFTGNNLKGKKAGSGKTAPTKYYLPETEPLNNVDGIDAKGQGKGSKWDRIKSKVYSASAQNVTKTRAAAFIGKYNLGRKWKYRKTLKKLLTATGAAASTGTPKGERNMFSDKGNGHTGTKNSAPAATQHPLYPIDSTK